MKCGINFSRWLLHLGPDSMPIDFSGSWIGPLILGCSSKCLQSPVLNWNFSRFSRGKLQETKCLN